MATTEKGTAYLDAHIARTAPRRYLIDVNAADAKAMPQPELYDNAIKRLAALSPHEYDRVRAEEAKTLQVRVTTLDDAVKALAMRNEQNETDSPFADVEPYPYPVVPGQLLDDISAAIRQFIILDIEQAHAAALWIAVCWFVDVIHCAPIGLINAPEKACGKTQLLTVLGKLVPRAAQASGISPSVLFRMIEAYRPTLLIDEVETVLTKENEDLRGLVNAGHTRDSAYVWRSVAKGDDFEPRRFSVWGMKAIAGINADRLAETVTSRSIIINLRKKLPHEKVDRLRNAQYGLFENLKAKLARFADDYSVQVRDARPALPEALSDRSQDNWEPLLAIAGCAGGEWVDRATAAALKLSGAGEKTVSTGNELLADIQHVFECKRVDKISTVDLINALCADDESAWATYNRGKQITFRQVSKQLSAYEISSKNIRIGHETPKGFERTQFADAFKRYLSVPLNLPPHPPQTLQANKHVTLRVAASIQPNSSKHKAATLKPAPMLACGGVADKTAVLEGAGVSVVKDPVIAKMEVTV
jgi:putative DNA primase/helicase